MKVHVKCPLRLGLAGGGTDVAPYSDIYGGMVLNVTISLYTHCEITLSDQGPIRFTASELDQHEVLPLGSELPLDGSLILHRAVYNRMVQKFNGGKPLSVEVLTYSDAPPGSGVGSSSALVVSMIAAYVKLLRLPLGDYEIAHLAFEIERVDCGMAGGKQDQYAATFGGFNFMEFGQDDLVVINPLRLRREVANDLESRLLLYFTGRSRASNQIIEEQIASTRVPRSDSLDAMHEIRQAAVEMKGALLRGETDRVLDILGASWFAKKRAASSISNSAIDVLTDCAMKAGARGVKISGAGGGGFMMIAVDPQHRHRVIRALEPLDGRFFSYGFVSEGVESWTCK